MYLLQILILYGALDVILDSMGFGPGHWQYYAVNALAILISLVSMLNVRRHKGD